MEDYKFDLEHSNEFMEKVNSEIKGLEEKLLKGKSPEEQQKLKMQWEKERLENEKKLEKQQKDFDNKMAKWNEEQQKLMSIEEIKTAG